MSVLRPVAGLCVSAALMGCGGVMPTPCTSSSAVSPASATLSHAAPGNSIQFSVVTTYRGDHCAVSAVAIGYQWAVSDAADASIVSNAMSGANGTATCHAAAASPIAVTPTPAVDQAATLVCR